MNPDGMWIGLGIFLGCVYLGTVHLYIHTRDRWNWKRLGVSLVGGVALGFLLIGTGVFLLHRWPAEQSKELARSAPVAPKVATSLGNITLGEAWSDVVFKLGEFQLREGLNSQQALPGAVYTQEPKGLTVHVQQGRVRYVVHRCPKETDSPVPLASSSISLNGISCGDPGEKIKAQFENVRVLCQKQASIVSARMRAYDVLEYGTRYVMYSNRVSALAIADKTELPALKGLSWDSCGLMPIEAKTVEPVQVKQATPK